MKSFVLHLLLSMLLLVIVVACGHNTVSADDESVSVVVDECHLSDTTSFVKSNGERCAIYADASILYPKTFKDKAHTEQLQRMFAAFVLNAPDSVSMDDAMHATVSNSLHQYDFVVQWPEEDEDDMRDTPPVYKYNTTTTVTVQFNQKDIITFCKTEVIKKNDKVTSVTHRYYSFDLVGMSYVDLHQLFREDAMAEVTQLLRAQLLEQNKVTNDDQLNDLGYFNVDNLSVTRNFFFDDKGMTWSYLPSQLAVDAIGEPQISLTYEKLMPLCNDNSLINRFN